MEPIENVVQILRENRPAAWDQLPDLELYMDQLLSYVNRQLPFDTDEQTLTKSMVNNYIKQEIIPRPNGKRYQQQHLASLSMLTILKEVLPIQDCQELFREVGLYDDTAKAYDFFLESLDSAFTRIADTLEQDHERDLGADALRFALFSYASRRVALAMLEKAQES